MNTSSNKPLVALIYTRVSTARQASEGLSLDMQANRTLEHAAARGWPVHGAFREEGLSGKLDAAKRPALKQLLAKAKELKANGNDVVIVVYSISRLTRSQRILLNIVEGDGLQISSCTEIFDTTTPYGKAMLGMLAVFAQLMADVGKEVTKESLSEAKASGIQLGRRQSIQKAPETVKLVKELYDQGLTQEAICIELMHRGVKTPMGKDKWHRRQVQICLEQALNAKKTANAVRLALTNPNVDEASAAVRQALLAQNQAT